ncbi:MAG TPA: response regulator transcription factor [Labilithrix sp.]|nr:response regulator transcription factor [Labilithrix sp.]
MPSRLVIFEDLTVVRDLLVAVFSADPRYEVIASFDDGAKGLTAALELRPDLALVDYVLPGLDGIEVSRRLMEAHPEIKVVLVTAHDRPEVLREGVELGVHGVVTKGAPLRTLQEAVAQVLEVGSYRCSATELALHEPPAPSERSPLTVREREIVALIATGLSSKQVADRLGISDKTVANHRANLMRKLDVHDVVALTHYAIERGLVPTRGGA